MARFTIYSPLNQLLIVGLVLFACPGLYGAITGLGAGGGKPSSAVVGNITNCVLYGVYTICALLAGSVLNVLGPKLTLGIGAIGYPLYAAGLWIYDRTGQEVPPIFFGAVLGVGAGFLWTAAGFVQYCYADESVKGLYIVLQWIIVACGSSIGAAIAFGVNYNKTESAQGSPTAIYLIFIIIEVIAIGLGFVYVVHPREIRRKDGTAIAVFQDKRTFREEAVAYAALLKDWKIWVLYVIGLSSEMCLSFQSTMSAHTFNLRTRSFVNLMFWLIQIPATLLLKPIFDANCRRRYRALMGASYLAVIVIAVWVEETIWLTGPNGITVEEDALNLDWTDSAAKVAPLFAGYMLNGVIYACWQSVVQYVISTLSNDPKLTARYAGLFKSSVSLGMTVSFGVTAAEVSFLKQLEWQFAQQMLSLALLFFICFFVTETNYYQEKDVIVPTYIKDIVKDRVNLDALKEHDVSAGTKFSSKRLDEESSNVRAVDDEKLDQE